MRRKVCERGLHMYFSRRLRALFFSQFIVFNFEGDIFNLTILPRGRKPSFLFYMDFDYLYKQQVIRNTEDVFV